MNTQKYRICLIFNIKLSKLKAVIKEKSYVFKNVATYWRAFYEHK